MNRERIWHITKPDGTETTRYSREGAKRYAHRIYGKEWRKHVRAYNFNTKQWTT